MRKGAQDANPALLVAHRVSHGPPWLPGNGCPRPQSRVPRDQLAVRAITHATPDEAHKLQQVATIRTKPAGDDGETGICLEQNAHVARQHEPSSTRPAPLWVSPGLFGYRPTLGNTIAAFHIARIQLPSIGGELADSAGESRT